MHIGIDTTSLIYGRGVSRYTANLVRALAKRPDITLSLYGSTFRQRTELNRLNREVLKGTPPTKASVTIQAYPPTLQNILWNWLHLNPVFNVLPGIQVFHSWDWLQPPDKNIPIVSTIHDLALLKFPETAHPQIKAMHETAWKKLRDSGSHVIAVSHATKKDIVELLSIPPYLVHVIHEALPVETVKTSEALSEEMYQECRQHLALDKPYILFVGTREPRKNLKRLIEAWEPLKHDFQLIIAGDKGWDDTAQTEMEKYQGQLRFLGRVTEQELVVLYGEANALAYPCLYEGFGLPILEAFYHGTPVLTSNVSSMIEVAGNAAELVDPESVESIRQGLTTLLHEDLTAQQKRLQRMIIRLQMFNWDIVAAETMKVYHQAIQEFA